ncbi:SUN domain-containing ossification factor-like [Myxocyprinus asiaticus]|uniref:SUN domain-containing ossification factor-like n=1 Tax=Myxocyprinus asiaticus TaxID=70543 RepID=UPI002222A834|nr:SUN domain-containing ossification factor-like [Myxocyprinus asiaticus]
MMKLELLLLCSLFGLCYWFPVHPCSEQTSGVHTQEHQEDPMKTRANLENISLSDVASSSSSQKQDASSQLADVQVSETHQSDSCSDCAPIDSCSAETIITDAAECDTAENLQYDPHLNSFPAVQENISVREAGKSTKMTHKEPTGKGTNVSHSLKEQGANITPESDPSVYCKDQEEIPTFDEWTKIMMEVENEKSHTHVSNGLHAAGKKLQQTFTNYASVECGAKILSSNPEAKSTSAILMENMDMYMLNPCNNKIWFIIELCQPIQVKQLDIANFEIFSSNTKDFLVSISDRYPTNKWVKLGTFHARDERTVQSFPLDEHLFAKFIKMFTKYVKVELLSHFGSEHFCPLSLIRVFGTSMMEEYEMNLEPVDRQQDDHDYDQPPDFVPLDEKSSKNLIGSAKDALLTMVNNIAANVLGGNPDNVAGGNSTVDLKMTETTFLPPAIHTTSSTVSLTAVLDPPQMKEISETSTSTQETTVDRVVLTPTASLLEDLTSKLPVEDVPVQTAPEIEQIVTLLPDEDENESDQFSKGKLFESKTDEQNCSCSHGFSLQEYLLQRCSSRPMIPKRKKKPNSRSQTLTALPHEKCSISTLIIPSQTHHIHAPITEEPVPSENPAILLVPKTQSRLESSDLDPSLTSDLLKSVSADSLSFKATHTIELACPSVTESCNAKFPQQSLENPMEANENPLHTNLSELTSSPAATNRSNQVGGGQISVTTEQSNLDNDLSTLRISKDIVDQSQHASSSTLVDPPMPKPSKSKMVTGGQLTPAQSVHPVDESAGSTEPKSKEILDEIDPNFEQPSPEVYAEMQNSSDVPVHGSSQKESVFMRLNNRIKVLEMNMSLSGRYLEQLSQRYRKQVEEMQKAFNKTIIKLQNTSRIAEEQDQRQTDSIHMLQTQLDNITQLVLNLSISVSQLQTEVLDRQSYIVLCLLLCVILGLLVSLNHHQMSESPAVESETSCYAQREVSYYEDVVLRRRASEPLSQSPFQIPTEEAGAEETNSLKQEHSTVSRKKKHKLKLNKSAENLMSTAFTGPSLANGIPQCTIGPQGLDLKLLSIESGAHLVPRDLMSDSSSEGSSQSDETLFCGIATCARICEALPAPKHWTEKKGHKQRYTPPGATAAHLHQPSHCSGPPAGFGPTLNPQKNCL